MLLVLFFWVTVLTRFADATNPATSLKAPGIDYVRCGEIFTCTTGTFQYKSPIANTRPERCAWLIAVPGAIKYAVKLDYPRNHWPVSSTSKDLKYSGLLLSSIRYNNDSLISFPLFSTQLPIEFAANVIVITFYSEPSESLSLANGFVISFQAEQALIPGAEIAAEYSEYSLRLPDNAPLRHPRNLNQQNRTTFGTVELSAIVLLPRDNFSDSSGKVKIVYQRLVEGEDIGCSLQSISIHSLKREAESYGFHNKGIFCDDITSFVQVTSDVTVVLVTSIRHMNDPKRNFLMTFVD